MKAITISTTDLKNPTQTFLARQSDSVCESTSRSLTTGYLDPTLLDESAIESVKAFLVQGESRNTSRTFKCAMQYWYAWFKLRYGMTLSLPVPQAAIIQFIVDHLEHVHSDGSEQHDLPDAIDRELVNLGVKARVGAQSLNTVTLRLAMLASAHRAQKLKCATHNEEVLELLRRIRAGFASRGIEPQSKLALTKELLQKVLNTCDGSLEGIRDRAILLFAFASGGRRRSEVCEARAENLFRAEGNGYIYRMGRSKTDPTGQALASVNFKPINGTAAAAITDWLTASGIAKGLLFREIKGHKITPEGLSGDALLYMIKKRISDAGLRGDFGFHSVRSGFVTECGAQDIPLADIMAMTGHRSVHSVIRYHQPGAMRSSRASRVFD